MKIIPITRSSGMWVKVAAYAQQCSWGAGRSLAREMNADGFQDWERVFVALAGDEIAGYCTLSKTDCIPDVPYTPYIGYVFVGEQFRGARLSQHLINCAMEYARELGFDRVYLVSDRVGLYEKYGFVKVDQKPAPWAPDTLETIFMHMLSHST